MKKAYEIITRLAFFIVYAWFGILKVLNLGEAYPLVSSLYQTFFPNNDSTIFFATLGLIEIYLGTLFLFPRLTKIAVTLTSIHLIITFLPYIFSVNRIWISNGVLTIEGQYILKNLFILSSLLGLWIIQDEREIKSID